MENNLDLGLDEVVILKKDDVKHGNGIFSGGTDTLILTNKRIIYIKKGMFGKEKGRESFLLSNIKIYNNKAQAVISSSDQFESTLEIYFINGVESFEFDSKSDVVTWIKKINELTTGTVIKDEEVNNSSGFATAIRSIANTIKEGINIYKGVFKEEEKKERISCKCEGCGATCTGFKGETTKCEYCGNFITFK